jgi:DNA (cytosine-5)-methyltransferase 1
MTLNYIDLFCGIGSFHYSFSKLKWKCVMACDINKQARETYEENYDMTPLGDICEIDPKDIKERVDIVCLGAPCQPFSNIGKREGVNDKRGTLFYQVIKFVKYHKPLFIVFENVEGLVNHDNGETLKKMLEKLDKCNYDTVYKVIKCSNYGIPQMRKRLFIIGIRKDISNNKISNILDFSKYEKDVELKDYLGKNFEKKYAYTIRCGGRLSPINDRHNWDGYFIDGEEYRLTLEDALKLQGFKDSFELVGTSSDKWRLLGNTIPTIFTKMVGKNLKKYYSEI